MIVLTEGGSGVGLGHVRRCLTVARALQAENVACSFHVRGADAARFIRGAGFEANEVDELGERLDSADAVMIDSYSVDPVLFTLAMPTVVIDDLADRVLPVDLVINPGAAAGELAYQGRADTRFLLGARYALLRPEFAQPTDRAIREDVERILFTLGGSDHGLLARDIVQWAMRHSTASIDVVVGPFFQHVDELTALAGDRVRLIREPENMRELMLQADVAISSGGQTLYELAATGTPGIAVRTADNQRNNIAALSAAGTIVAFDDHALSRVAAPHVREEMSRRGKALVDGRGAERVAKEIARILKARRMSG